MHYCIQSNVHWQLPCRARVLEMSFRNQYATVISSYVADHETAISRITGQPLRLSLSVEKPADGMREICGFPTNSPITKTPAIGYNSTLDENRSPSAEQRIDGQKEGQKQKKA